MVIQYHIMKFTDLKYLLAYIIPASGFVAVYFQNGWSYLTFIIAFVMLPTIEQIVPRSTQNFDKETAEFKSNQWIFDILLFLNLPIILCLLFYFFTTLNNPEISISTLELVGLYLSVGIVLGACGINVAHELGHKPQKLHKLAAQALLMPCLYMHFYIEHNRGHHLHVATRKDPASSRKGENVYFFWIRSTSMSYLAAWSLEAKRLKKSNTLDKILRNQMIHFSLVQAIYLFLVYFNFGLSGIVAALSVALVSFLLLETINYIEHYGLSRNKLSNGRYERVMPWHSWNSNHELGRIMLYELTRHSDHHFLANKKYQVLDHHDKSPQLPLGYPASMLMALVPPLWFSVMNKKLDQFTTPST